MHWTRSATISITAAVAVLMTWGCSSTRPIDWTNHNISEVIRQFGQPALVAPVAERSGPHPVIYTPGVKLYVWKQTKSGVESNRSAGNPEGGFEATTTCLMWIFTVDPTGTIKEYTLQKLPWVCPAGPTID